jgi:hypothetical protein
MEIFEEVAMNTTVCKPPSYWMTLLSSENTVLRICTISYIISIIKYQTSDLLWKWNFEEKRLFNNYRVEETYTDRKIPSLQV